MKTLITVLLLAAASTLRAVSPERVIFTEDRTLAEVRQLLARGWTVKYQSMTSYAFDYRERAGNEQRVFMLFTLSAPTGEALEAEKKLEADTILQAQAAWRARVEEARAKRNPPVEKSR